MPKKGSQGASGIAGAINVDVEDTDSNQLEKNKIRTLGKRSDPDYLQITAYIRKDVHKAVKRKLVGEDKDMSDVIGGLLEGWLS